MNNPDIGALFKKYRERTQRRPRDVARSLKKLASKHQEADTWATFCRRFLNSTPRTLVPLEKGTFNRLALHDIYRIADAYHIPRLMLDPLFSTKSHNPFVQGSLDQFEPAKHTTTRRECNAKYRVPHVRLHSTDTAFVLLDLPAHGDHSIYHSHCGDELMYVLSGCIEVRFQNSGMRTTIPAHGYIHFYAEQPHGAWNVGAGPAQVLVIRFYQLFNPGVRHEISDAILRACKASTPLPAPVLSELASRERVEDFNTSASVGNVRDHLGLLRLLKRIRGDAHTPYIDLGKESNTSATTAYRRMHPPPGTVPRITKDNLQAYAKANNIAPLLLYDFLYPAVSNGVVVRSTKHAMQPIESTFIGREGVTYSVPRRHLADSDIAISVLRLAPNASTPRNQHPGQELLIPLSGRLRVQLESDVLLDSANRQYIHFDSEIDHEVFNAGDNSAEVFVVRFYNTASPLAHG